MLLLLFEYHIQYLESLIPTLAKIMVPPKADNIATQTKACSTSPIHGRTVMLFDKSPQYWSKSNKCH